MRLDDETVDLRDEPVDTADRQQRQQQELPRELDEDIDAGAHWTTPALMTSPATP